MKTLNLPLVFFFLFNFILFPPYVYSMDDIGREIFGQGCIDNAKKNNPQKLNDTVIEMYCDCISKGVSEAFTRDSFNEMLRKLEKKWIKDGKGSMRGLMWEEPFFKNLILSCFEGIEENYDGPLYQ